MSSLYYHVHLVISSFLRCFRRVLFAAVVFLTSFLPFLFYLSTFVFVICRCTGLRRRARQERPGKTRREKAIGENHYNSLIPPPPFSSRRCLLALLPVFVRGKDDDAWW